MKFNLDFDRTHVSYINCSDGINGNLPTEFTSFDIIENKNKHCGKDVPVVGLVSPYLLETLHMVNRFFPYPSTIKSTLFENEIGILDTIRFVCDQSRQAWDEHHVALFGVSYSLYLISYQLIFEEKNHSNFTYTVHKVIDIRSSLK